MVPIDRRERTDGRTGSLRQATTPKLSCANCGTISGGDTAGEKRALVMRVRIPVLSVALLVMPVLTLAQGPKLTAKTPPASHAMVTPDELVWKPLIPGVEMVVVSGDPDKKAVCT
jgi:hypothetical protein